MITSVTIENFRAFSISTQIRLKPITILIGQNSAGKSTFIKFLLMLQQSLSRDSDFLVVDGTKTQLGSFDAIVNVRSRKKDISFSMEAKEHQRNYSDLMTIRDLTPNTHNDKSIKKHKFEMSFDLSSVDTKGAPLQTMRYSAIIGRSNRQWRGRQTIEVITNKKTDFRQSVPIAKHHFLDFEPIPTAKTLESFAIEKAMKRIFRNRELTESFRTFLRGIRHLSPIREEFQRTVAARTPPEDQVGTRGENTLFHLHSLLKKESDTRKFISEHALRIANVKELSMKQELKGYLRSAKGTNPDTLANVYLADFGFGVSQCMPLIVQAAMMKKDEHLVVEQPEAHLHPTAQLSLGDLFVDLWTRRGVRSIIETHSPNILLRIRHLVAAKKVNADDISVAYFCLQDGKVTVKNLDVNPNGSLQSGLPFEFFGADVLEAMELTGAQQ